MEKEEVEAAGARKKEPEVQTLSSPIPDWTEDVTPTVASGSVPTML